MVVMRKNSVTTSLLAVSLLLSGQAQAQTITKVSEALPNAALFYDYDADGNKEFFCKPSERPMVFKGDTIWDDYLFLTESYSGSFEKKQIMTTEYTEQLFMFDDINNDGIIDMSGVWMDYFNQKNTIRKITTLCSGENGYSILRDKLLLPGCDLNNDGRTDLLSFGMWHDNGGAILDGPASDGTGYIYSDRKYISYRIPDGTFRTERMQIMTQEEYESQFDPESWYSPAAWNGLLSPGGRGFNLSSSLSAVSLARAPMRADIKVSQALNNTTSNGPLRAAGMGSYILAPTKAIDLNGDDLVDLIDENEGIIYFNAGDGRWIINEIGGQVITADFNNDGIQDYLFPGEKLELFVYTGAGEFNRQTLYRNIAVDKDIYCYDFDHDGDVDILVTFSAPLNRTEYAYTMFFANDGKGVFTQKDEQDYGDLKLYFVNCQDIDGDGYMDMLAFNCYKPEYIEYYDYDELRQYPNDSWFADGGIYLLKGKSDLTFSEPVKLFNLYEPHWQEGNYDDREFFYGIKDEYIRDYKINAEDIDNDGKTEIWLSRATDDHNDGYGLDFKNYYSVDDAVSNTAPDAPGKPSVIYENGWLLVNWGDGRDAETQTIDLTYALRIGTAPGGSDIVYAHANADGSRRNYLDGNMLKKHSYSIDLSSYAPSDIYIAVQAIDAQHKGSAWSEEATVRHNILPATFVVDNDKINMNDTVTVRFTPMPAGYSHKWVIEDGSVVDEIDNIVRICFEKAGNKPITHVLSGNDGTTSQYVVNVLVMDIALSEAVPTDEKIYELLRSRGYVGQAILADYNYDGYHDFVYDDVIWRGSDKLTISKAPGVWNTDVSVDGKWFDWDHNGSADYIFTQGLWEDAVYYYLPHNESSNLSSRQSDEGLKWFFKDLGNTIDDEFSENASMFLVDLLHDGYYSMFGEKYNYRNGEVENYVIFKRNQEGEYESFSIIPNDVDWMYWVCHNKDVNHDGFADLVGYYTEDDYVTNLLFFYNHGQNGLEKVAVPLEKKMAMDDLGGLSLVDFNNDGYYDLFGYRKIDSAPYIMWNKQNNSFSAPYVFPLGDLQSFHDQSYDYTKTEYIFADMNNDGYIDVLSRQPNSSNGETGLYVFFMGAYGVADQGFIYPWFTNTVLHRVNSKWVASWRSENNGYEYQFILPARGNEKPAAPAGVRAVQTADGLLIEWDAAKDDYTPAVQMRYNISVKHKGQIGAGAFVISPQNGLNSKAAYLPGYEYTAATRYEIPLSALTVGVYEIQIQAIDLQNEMGEFSEPLEITIDRQVIEAPTVVSIGKEAIITYMGESSTGTPSWDFDGGTVVSGNGFGPYHVSWNAGGVKTLKLTLNGTVYERMIAVDVNDAQVTLPEYLFEGYSTAVDVPDNMTSRWYLLIEDEEYALNPAGIQSRDWSDEITVSDNIITVNESLGSLDIALRLILTNANGTEKVFEQPISILTKNEMPYIKLIDSDDEGHSVIRFEAMAQYYPEVKILKETNIYNQFVEIGRVAATEGSYTDMLSDLKTKSERYTVAGVMQNGMVSPESKPHMNVHMNINRGISNDYNLIWNKYEGAQVQTYNILRGSSESALTQIASVSGSNTSYTDNAPDGSEPFYAIEFVLKAGTSNAPLREFAALHSTSRSSDMAGRSNTVNTNGAYKATYVTKLSIQSSNNVYKLTEEKPAIYLYVEILPVNATYKSVTWEIVDGEELATIDDGLLTAKNPNRGGTVTVKASAVDGSDVYATRKITVESFGKYTVIFYDWDKTVLQKSELAYGEMPSFSGPEPSRESTDEYDYTFIGWSPEVNAVTGDAYYIAQYKETSTGVDIIRTNGNLPDHAMKYIDENGKLFLLLPDGRKIDIWGRTR